MPKNAEDCIPKDMLAAAQAAGLKHVPLFGVGTIGGRDRTKHQLEHGLGKIVADAYQEAGIEQPARDPGLTAEGI